MDLCTYLANEIPRACVGIDSQVLLVGQWNLDDETPSDAFSVRYYGTARDPRALQLDDCVTRAPWLASAHIATRLPDGSWIVGRVRASMGDF
jgi:hypothetical protein